MPRRCGCWPLIAEHNSRTQMVSMLAVGRTSKFGDAALYGSKGTACACSGLCRNLTGVATASSRVGARLPGHAVAAHGPSQPPSPSAAAVRSPHPGLAIPHAPCWASAVTCLVQICGHMSLSIGVAHAIDLDVDALTGSLGRSQAAPRTLTGTDVPRASGSAANGIHPLS